MAITTDLCRMIEKEHSILWRHVISRDRVQAAQSVSRIRRLMSEVLLEMDKEEKNA